MPDSLTELEQQLLSDPFDNALRRRYAEALGSSQRHADALAQLRLVIKQLGDAATADLLLSAAQHAARVPDPHAKGELLAAARRRADFDAGDPRLAALDAAPAPQGLRAIPGGKSALPATGEVISIASTDKVRFADVVGMSDLKKLIRLRIIEPFVKPGLLGAFPGLQG